MPGFFYESLPLTPTAPGSVQAPAGGFWLPVAQSGPSIALTGPGADLIEIAGLALVDLGES